MLVDAQSEAASRFSLLNACVDEPVNGTACRYETWALDADPFDCASLPICDITCGGPSVQVLRTAAQHCACSAEWWLHATILRLCAAFVIFLVLQLSRSWIVDGLCRLNWRRLTDVFGYEASCDIDGNPVVDGDVRAHVRGHTAARAWLCREVEGYGSGARPRGVGRAVGAVAAGFGVRAQLMRMVFLIE